MCFLNAGQVASPIPLTSKLLLILIMLLRSIFSTQEAIESLFKIKLLLFCKFHMGNANGFNPLMGQNL